MILLDTDVCVELLRGNEAVAERRREVDEPVASTWITAAELFYGAARSAKPRHNRDVVIRFLATVFLHGLDARSVERFGAMKRALEGDGTPVADADLFIASIALARGATLVTGNRKHYERVPGLVMEDWLRG